MTTPTTAPEPTKVPSQNTPGPSSTGPSTPAADTPAAEATARIAPAQSAPVQSAPAQNSQQFPPTLVGLDPPTLPAADGMKPPHRDVDARGPADLPQFRPFPHPQRSEPGHPGLRRMWRRLLTFWRRTKI
ncbi:hypothetical protein [Pseudonocardia sediminis]|uniref:hypothetical protein n=1 Tax=Pseudonocardia sediminis TaxID=1397368 RepID=UPI0010292D02|nr:hypothetical protein [Pseudonocardia sediminis]